MDFYAIDVETANANQASICQIGIAAFQNGEVTDVWETLVDPQDYFDPFNVRIHGISEQQVSGAPSFQDIIPELRSRLEGNIAVHHMPFDRNAINQASRKYGEEAPQTTWLDSASVTRRAWPQFGRKGYGLANITSFLGIDLRNHHDALSDAKAAGYVLVHACRETGKSPEDWLTSLKPSSRTGGSTPIRLEGNADGPLLGERIVFTGALSMVRSEAARLAAEAGCQVGSNVTQKTTILVVGLQTSYLGGYEKSSKHRKAESMSEKGIPIQIISEEDFISLVAST